MLRVEEIEAISHNIAKMSIDIQTQQFIQRGQMLPMPKEIANEYLRVYLEAKQTTMEYLQRQKLEEEKKNPFSPNYSPNQEHPKLMPMEDFESKTR